MTRLDRSHLARSTTWLWVAVALAAVGAWTWRQPVNSAPHVSTSGELIITVDDLGEPVLLGVRGALDATITWTGPVGPGTRLLTWTEVSSSTGWTRRPHSPVSTGLTPDRRSASATLDLVRADGLADRLDRLTSTSGARQVALVAELHDATGAVAHARLTFDLTATVAMPAVPPVTGGPGPASAPVIDRVRIDRPVPSDRVPHRIGLGVAEVETATARRAVATATILAATLAGTASVVERRRRHRSIADDASVRFGRSTVWAQSVTCTADTLVDMPDIDSLAAIGRDLDLPLIAEADDDRVVYRVIDGTTVYRFTAPTASVRSTPVGPRSADMAPTGSAP